MKLIIMFLLYSFSANATTYYVSNAGSDAAAGTSTGTSWQTLSKVNSSSFLPGDQILLNKGDSWNERLVFPSSGTALNPIVISSYGTGNKPIITGLQTLSGFTNTSGHIWSVTASNSVDNLNTVLINGVIRAKGRYPNTGYLIISSSVWDSTIVTGLSGTPDYTDAEAVIRTAHYVTDVSKISSQSGGTLHLATKVTYHFSMAGYGFFIQNSPLVLDTLNEWSYNTTTKLFSIYSLTDPSGTVQYSTIDTTHWIRSKDYITFDGLSIIGANKAAFQIDTSRHLTIQNCSINNSGTLAISAAKSAYVTVQNDSIQNSLSGAIYLRRVDPYTPMQDTCNNALVYNNYIKNTACFAGMGLNSNGRYNAINVVGTPVTITLNTIDSTGYIPIIWEGNGLIKNNYITNFCTVKSEGGGIYTVIGSVFPGTYDQGSIIRSNIILHGKGGEWTSGDFAAGVYLDDAVFGVTIDSNTIADCAGGGLAFNDGRTFTLKDNTVIDSIGTCFVATNLGASGYTIRRNIFYSQSTSKYVISFGFQPFSGTSDSNYLLRPVLEANLINRTSTNYSIAAWTASTGYEANSHGTPAGITAALPLFYINPTLVDSTILLTGLYYDAKGAAYNNSITIAPFQSALLFKSTSEVPEVLTSKKIGNFIFE